jgi:GNAT superfamily N-acetyltransferase
MAHIERMEPAHLPQVQRLVNAHLSTLAPGWALPEHVIVSRLQRDPGEFIVDPWVIARATLCALERQRVVAAAHLLRYGSGVEVNGPYRNVGEIAWFLAWPDAGPAAAALLDAAREHFGRWGVSAIWAWQGALPVGLFAGVPDVWPHIATALAAAGYRPDPAAAREEAIYGGRLDQIPPPTDPPIAGMTIRRSTGLFGTRFAAAIDGQDAGYCDCVSDLTEGGAVPALHGWAELAELAVREPWRNRGIGIWLVQHAAAWLRLGGCDRIILAVAAEDEAAGAGRFYERQGWQALVRLQRGWVLASHISTEPKGSEHAQHSR